ncbi:fluoride efflux transporter FluC [Micromonospora zhanjiangensis]|uniref:Fluoride-specific ion channel FluC n=1 Tax=Micromonospora zhanjiangensis TaxID=1522057 RepID=A0ABV8KZ96_9ACTN
MSEFERPPIDPDVDLHVPAERRELRPRPWPVLAAISAGGVLGALARYGLQSAFPHPATGFPWATFGTNVSGCLLIGVLMVLVTQVWPGRALVRPFLGVGVLGGFTTFSTYVVDIQQAAVAGAARVALAYLALTLAGAMVAVWAGASLTSRLVRPGATAGRSPDEPTADPGGGGR